MAVSGINSYTDVMYQWQAQQLKSTGNSTTASNTVSSLLGNASSMTSQLSSMIELTRYAMDAMGLASDSRVTFSQITKYRQQLQNEFNQGVREGFANSGISNMAALEFTLDKDGKITVSGSNASDRSKAQAWLDANSSLGAELLKSLEDAEFSDAVKFHISSTGRITVEDTRASSLQSSLDQEQELAAEVRTAFEQMGINISAPLNLSFDGNGNLVATGDNAHQINQWLETNSNLSVKIRNQLEKLGIDQSSVSFRLGQDGSLQASVKNNDTSKVEAALNNENNTGLKIYNGLSHLKINADANFSIQIMDDGSLNIISDHPDRDKIQRFFEENPDLVKKFRQIETLAGIDDARKSMQISPTEMRKRIQIESMASWWATSGNASSYFGNYSSDGLSLLAGLNLKV